MQNQNNQQQAQQQKAMIYIENLDQGISEDYLYRKFKEVGEIQSLKIAKDKSTQKSKGQAYITFAHPDIADEARKKFNNIVFIKNIIRVKAYFNYHNADKKANIFINNLPEDADTLELEQEFSRYGTVLSVDIHRDPVGKALSYGYVQFEKKEDADHLIATQDGQGINYKGKVLKLEQFKAQSERKTESTSIYLRAFARPLNDNEIKSVEVTRAIEFAWQLLIKDFFIRNNVEVKDCFVKIDNFNRQPWAMVNFGSADLARNNIDVCEKNRFHPCIKGSAAKALELLQKNKAPATSDGALQFQLAAVAPFFEAQAKSHDDVFKGESNDFFFNQVYSKHLNPDDRLILVQNIREEVTKEELTQFLGQFGKVIRLTVRKPKSARFPVQQCFVHYQTLEDSKRARSEVYDDHNTKIVEQRKKVFKDGHVMMNILLSKAVRKEYKEIKKHSQSIFQNPAGRVLLQPTQNFVFPPQQRVQFMHRPQAMPQRIPRGVPPQFAPHPYMKPNNMGPRGVGQFPPQQGFQRPPQMGMGQRYPPQQQFMQHPFQPQGQMPQQVNPIEKFSSFENVGQNIDEFNKLPNDLQRKILGNLLVIKIDSLTNEKQYIKTIVGMLVDEKQFDIGEILNFLEDDNELNERVEEALELIHQNQNNENQ